MTYAPGSAFAAGAAAVVADSAGLPLLLCIPPPAFPRIRSRPVSEVTTVDVLELPTDPAPDLARESPSRPLRAAAHRRADVVNHRDKPQSGQPCNRPGPGAPQKPSDPAAMRAFLHRNLAAVSLPGNRRLPRQWLSGPNTDRRQPPINSVIRSTASVTASTAAP